MPSFQMKGETMEGNLIFFTTQWFTIQPDLFGRIEDEVGELGESEKEFVRICTTALNSGRFAKYRWCGNRQSPVLRRLCGWGCKRDSKGKRKTWRGYKLHVSCADGDIPLAAFLSSANLHEAHGGKFVRVRNHTTFAEERPLHERRHRRRKRNSLKSTTRDSSPDSKRVPNPDRCTEGRVPSPRHR